VELLNGTTLGFTNHRLPLIIDSLTYTSTYGYVISDIVTSDALNTDNLELKGPQATPFPTDDDILSGLWDHATVTIFTVNYADLTMGKMYERYGWLGDISLGLYAFTAQIRGLMERYKATIGELTSPGCRVENFGDARCKKPLGPLTVTSTLTGVGADNMTFYDTARTEPGAGTGVAITNVSNANPGVVTMANASLNLSPAQIVTLYGIAGALGVLLNKTTVANNPSGATFQLSVDTTSYPAYSSGGYVLPLGSATGYFDGGVMTFTSGLNNGISRPVKTYAPGQWTMFVPFPKLAVIGDTYTMVAGCNRSYATCRDTYNNLLNFRGEPHMGGFDDLIQVGRGTSDTA
jgi:hypothetical protein